MSNKFKVGDKVRIKEVDAWLLRHGKNVGDELTVARIQVSRFELGRILLVFEELLSKAPNHERFSERFELAPAVPPFKVGDKVRVKVDAQHPDHKGVQHYAREGVIGVVMGGPTPAGSMDVEFDRDDVRVTANVTSPRVCQYVNPANLELFVEPPRDFRRVINGNVGSASFKSAEVAIEAARQAIGEGTEFDIVEVVVVSKHTVRKVGEARA